jgi:hypothetical protein
MFVGKGRAPLMWKPNKIGRQRILDEHAQVALCVSRSVFNFPVLVYRLP